MLPFICQLPSSDGSQVDVSVAEIQRTFVAPPPCQRWVDLVHQPFIARDTTRTDRTWDWSLEIPLLTFGGGFKRQPRMFQLCLAEENFPIGMLALLEGERWIANHREPAVWVWYLTAAPPAAVARFGAPKLMTRATLDIAVTVSLNGPAGGRLWLHAAPEGGDRLLEWYRGVGLEQVDPGTILPQPAIARRPNDGRYFQTTAESALRFYSSLEEYRN